MERNRTDVEFKVKVKIGSISALIQCLSCPAYEVQKLQLEVSANRQSHQCRLNFLVIAILAWPGCDWRHD